MDILAKMKEKDAQFEQLKASAVERRNKIKEIQDEANGAIQGLGNEISKISEEMTKIQGEYRILTELGVESGVLNEDGSIKTEQETADQEAE
jgi:uncharacterized coiled-coil DUF342 family protein